MKEKHKTPPTEPITVNPSKGLSDLQVRSMREAGAVNKVKNKNSKSYFKIIVDNVCTFYNLLALACFITLLTVHTQKTSVSDYAFVIIYLVNIAIGIFQEVRAKKTLEKLQLIKAPAATVVRNGESLTIPVDEIVLSDVIILSLGDQIPADCVILEGKIEVNESMLTGESHPIIKSEGQTLYGGSFVHSGRAVAQAVKVGENSYVQTLSAKAKKFKKTKSELTRTMNYIINVVGLLIIPIAILSATINYNYLSSKALDTTVGAETIKRTVAVIIGMIPGGMFLLTTVALAVGIVKLAKKNTLVQDMYSLEMLARVNVLCLDKTGTITDGNQTVREIVPLNGKDYSAVIYNMEVALGDDNLTARALKNKLKCEVSFTPTQKLAFSSERKFSAITFENQGTFVLGAPDYVVKDLDSQIKRLIDEHLSNGRRVLMLASAENFPSEDGSISGAVTPLTLIVLEDNIRPEAVETIKWFYENGVDVKIISGDDPLTVARISERAGVRNSDKYISLYGLTDEQVIKACDEFVVFGRVSPEQKALIIKTLKGKGGCVAMTGDGVNDILAMKEADCAITVASGNTSARSLAHLVLLSDDFNCLPQVVREGRRVINNTQRSSALYLMKTVFTVLLSLGSIILGTVYPLTTGYMLPLEMLIIGLPSILLSVEPNDETVKGRFIDTVLINALPGTFILLVNVLIAQNSDILGIGSPDIRQAIIVLSLTLGGLAYLTSLCYPLNKFRGSLLLIVTVIIVVWALFLSASPMFALPKISLDKNGLAIAFLIGLTIVDIPLVFGFKKLLKIALEPKKQN